MKFLQKISNESSINLLDKPNVILLEDTGQVKYNVNAQGVFWQLVDGTLIPLSEDGFKYYYKSDFNGVAVLDPEASFVISKEILGLDIKWSSDTTNVVEGVMVTTDSEEGKTDYAGKENTLLIIATDTSGAAYQCNNYIFPNGNRGYLPSYGELAIAYKYKEQIYEAFSMLGYPNMTHVWWSSTQRSDTESWYYAWNVGGVTSGFTKSTGRAVRAFTSVK